MPRPTIAWDEKNPLFHVVSDDPDALKAAKNFAKRFVYYVGSDNGCGCGFRGEYDFMITDPKELASKTDNHKRLHAYLADCLRDEETIELYSCWSGDEALPFESEKSVVLEELLLDSFHFVEGQKLSIRVSSG